MYIHSSKSIALSNWTSWYYAQHEVLTSVMFRTGVDWDVTLHLRFSQRSCWGLTSPWT